MNWIYAVDFSIKWFHDLIRYFMILFHCTIEASHCISLLVLTTHFMGHSYIVSFLKNSHYCHRHREFGQIWVKWPVLASLKIFEPSDFGVSGLFKCLNFFKIVKSFRVEWWRVMKVVDLIKLIWFYPKVSLIWHTKRASRYFLRLIFEATRYFGRFFYIMM